MPLRLKSTPELSKFSKMNPTWRPNGSQIARKSIEKTIESFDEKIDEKTNQNAPNLSPQEGKVKYPPKSKEGRFPEGDDRKSMKNQIKGRVFIPPPFRNPPCLLC